MLEELRRRLVSDRDDRLRRRRPGDAARAVVAAALFALLAWHAGNYWTPERKLTHLLESLPDDAHSLAKGAYGLLALWVLGIVVVGVVLARRWRLARDIAVAGALAWFLGRLFAFATHKSDLAHAFSVVFDLRHAPQFPLVRVAMLVAVVTVASAYLTRPTRWVGRGVVTALGLVAMYLGRAYLTDLLGAFLLGWGVANLVRFAFASPVGRPTLPQVGRALERAGLEVTGLRAAPDQPVGRARFLAESAEHGPVRIVAIGRDEADANFLAGLWRYVAYRDAPPVVFATRRQQVEYEAYVCLLASAMGASVPHVLVAASSGEVSVLVDTLPAGVALFSVDPADVSDRLLDDLWCQQRVLAGAGIAHGALDGEHVVVDGQKVSIVGWDDASAGANRHLVARDVAQLLAGMASVVGPVRAIDAAARVVGTQAIGSALPFLQPAALSGSTRDRLDRGDGIEPAVAEIRTRAAEASDREAPELRRLYRVHPRQLLMAVGALFGLFVLFSRVGDPAEFWASIRDASWGFVVLSFILGMATDVAFALAFVGTVPLRLPVWPAIELQSSLSFANLAVPVAADTALQIRFLQRNGLEVSEAIATGGVLSTVSELVVQLGLFFVALWLAPDSIEFGHIDTSQIVVVVLIVVFALGVASAVMLGVRRIRRQVVPPVLRALRAVWSAVKSPYRVALMICGNIAAYCLYAASLLCCLRAFGSSLDFFTLLALNIGIGLVASLVPIPGGGTAVSAIGISGMMVALGVPTADATAAILAHQLAVNYLPAIPGWFATQDLVRRRML